MSHFEKYEKLYRSKALLMFTIHSYPFAQSLLLRDIGWDLRNWEFGFQNCVF